jgi:hypothetical protein
MPQHVTQADLDFGPFKRLLLAGEFLQRLPIGSDGFFNLRRFSLALPEREERGAQIDQRLSPFGRYSLAVLLL